jgi:hypothetical protein
MIGAPSFNVRINPENTEIVISYEPPVIGAPSCIAMIHPENQKFKYNEMLSEICSTICCQKYIQKRCIYKFSYICETEDNA